MKVKITIQNCSDEDMNITKEPEALEAFIKPNDEIKVETNEEEENIYINVGKNDDGTIYIQIWDALKTQYKIYHQGKNMFEDYL
ncbi:hypothetical protein VUJ46_17075 [Chryseobacterium sp. MYb264]|uniref:hypothetical protein n=1 Tax=Chryseobacterium sp. MYb264 TaxID=2745153 RepID=UPI002E119FA6|nr:hypothetical protein VUJ46_17075 [Chryseobacterium sp. MYb264]